MAVAIIVIIDLMRLTPRLAWPGLVAHMTLVFEVILALHVLLSGTLRAEEAVATVAFKHRGPVTSDLAMLITIDGPGKNQPAVVTLEVPVPRHLGRWNVIYFIYGFDIRCDCYKAERCGT